MTMKIVVVEDEIRIREGICNLIHKMFSQHEIAGEAENGEEGLTLIRNLRPELVITDIRMESMDGLQMLTQLQAEGIKFKAIVLSAYSEFTYAQEAIKLGVNEYLLKPIVVSDFAQAIKSIERQMEEEKTDNPQILGDMENIMFGIIYGGMQPNEELYQFIQKKYKFSGSETFAEVQIYVGKEHAGKKYADRSEKMKHELTAELDKKEDLKYCILDNPKEYMLLLILYKCKELAKVERWFQNYIMQYYGKNSRQEIGCGWTNVDGITQLKEATQTLAKYMEWNIALGGTIMISYPKILQVQTFPCVYPIDLENEMKIALCTYDMTKVNKCMQRFKSYFADGQVYRPKEIKESYVRFLWAMMNLAKEIGTLREENVEQQKILETIMNAVSLMQLEQVFEEVLENITPDVQMENGTASLTIKRAKSMIQEFYDTGITLDEITTRLNITPEYLGTQFHREVGVNFSTFIKELRMKKAKELLLGSNMKLYEIAEKVGYTDAKYFSRVFRESTGQLPAEYRKTNK